MFLEIPPLPIAIIVCITAATFFLIATFVLAFLQDRGWRLARLSGFWLPSIILMIVSVFLGAVFGKAYLSGATTDVQDQVRQQYGIDLTYKQANMISRSALSGSARDISGSRSNPYESPMNIGSVWVEYDGEQYMADAAFTFKSIDDRTYLDMMLVGESNKLTVVDSDTAGEVAANADLTAADEADDDVSD